MSSTANKKKKVVKKKVIKKVVKKKVKKTESSPNYQNKSYTNGHTKMKPIPNGVKSANRPHRPSIEDAITQFTSVIEKLKKENQKLKGENYKLKKQIEEIKSKPPETKVVYIRKGIKPTGGPPKRSLPSMNAKPKPQIFTAPKNTNTNTKSQSSSSDTIVSNINKDDAKNALAGLFGAKRTTKTPQNNTSKSNDDTIVSNINKDDAKNALAGLFGAKKSPSPAKPNSTKSKNSNNGKVNLEITTPPKLAKYVKLSKIMPPHVLENRMKMDGITRMLIGQLTKQWMPAAIPENVKIISGKKVAPPPPISSEFSEYIEKKDENGEAIDDDLYEKLRSLGLKPKAKITPSRKMKRFHWKKIEIDDIPPTLWKDVDDSDIAFNKIEFELKFQFRTSRPNTKKVATKQDRKGQKYLFVEPKRSQNLQIFLSRIKLTDEQLKEAVIKMDDSVFTLDFLPGFIEMAPNEDEQREAEMHAMKEDVDAKYFGRSEQFIYTFVDMVDLSIRLELWLFMQNFKEMVSDRQATIFSLQSGVRALSECVSFKQILTLLLAWGNHMNGGSHAGQAYGFEIDTLSLLPGVKTMDTSMNLMMYLYKTLYEKFPSYLEVMNDLKAIKGCASIESEALDKSVGEIKEKFDLLKTTLTRFEEDYFDVLPIDDCFISYSKEWLKKNQKHLTKLLMLHKRTKTKCQQLAVLFKWDLEMYRIENLFSICNQFVSDLYVARDALHKLEIDREKRRRKKKRKKKKEIIKEQHERKQRMKGIQKTKRSIMDDVRNRRRKNTALLEKVGAKLTQSLIEKSKLIEATNDKKQLPETFKKNKVKRKMSNIYGKNVEKVKRVKPGRMRLPTVVSKKGLPSLPALKQGDEQTIKKYKNQLGTKRKKQRRHVQQRKRTKGWFKKGNEPKVNVTMIRNAPSYKKGIYAQPKMAYNPLTEYETNYKNAHQRGRGISNNKDDLKGNRWRSDTPTNPTALAGQKVAEAWKKQSGAAYGQPKPNKRAKSMIVGGAKRIDRKAYSPPNMGIVRLNKMGLVNDENGKKRKSKSSRDLNLPDILADGADDFLLESPQCSPEPPSRKASRHSTYKFTEESSWD